MTLRVRPWLLLLTTLPGPAPHGSGALLPSWESDTWQGVPALIGLLGGKALVLYLDQNRVCTQ